MLSGPRLYRNLAKRLQSAPPNQVLTKTLALNTLRDATGLGIRVENVVPDPVFTGKAEGRAVGLAHMFLEGKRRRDP